MLRSNVLSVEASTSGRSADSARVRQQDPYYSVEGAQLDGHNLYTVTFAPPPPVKGFWSLTLYNAQHLFNTNPLKAYSLGTKNKTLQIQRGRFAHDICGCSVSRQG
jgi:Protein of unknown function (DUF1214)